MSMSSERKVTTSEKRKRGNRQRKIERRRNTHLLYLVVEWVLHLIQVDEEVHQRGIS